MAKSTPRTEKVKGKYQFKNRKLQLERIGTKITSFGKFPKDEVEEGYTHYITYEEIEKS